jgi:hypothetical protein
MLPWQHQRQPPGYELLQPPWPLQAFLLLQACASVLQLPSPLQAFCPLQEFLSAGALLLEAGLELERSSMQLASAPAMIPVMAAAKRMLLVFTWFSDGYPSDTHSR